MTLLNLRRLRLARVWGHATKTSIRLGLPVSARETARVAARWAILALHTPLRRHERQQLSRSRTVHGHRGSRLSGSRKCSPVYTSWLNMKQRCTNPKSGQFHNYGARGITISPRWVNSFENFLADMGERPEGCSLDRIDVNGNYEPGNCRWATASQQCRNTRVVALNTEAVKVIRWGAARGVPLSLLARLNRVSHQTAYAVARGDMWKEIA